MRYEFDPVENLFKSLGESSMIIGAGVKPVVDELKPVVGFYARKKTVELIRKVDGLMRNRSAFRKTVFDNRIHTPTFRVRK